MCECLLWFKYSSRQCRMVVADIKLSDHVVGFDLDFSCPRSPEGEMDIRLDKKRKNAQSSCVIS